MENRLWQPDSKGYRFRKTHMAVALVLTQICAAQTAADDWPQWRGPKRDGVWRETGILESMPADGLKVRWRARIGAGYSGPVVANGRVFVSDRQLRPDVERVLCFEESTGKPLWVHSYACDYENMDYGSGPRASPTVVGGKVYTLGARGHVYCLDETSGTVVWKKDLIKDYGARVPRWGASAAPLVEGSVVIVCAGAPPEASVIAFAKDTGKEVWKALADRPAYSAPIVVHAAGQRQVIVRTADAINALDPATGKLFWRIDWKLPENYEYAVVATPIADGSRLFCITGYGRGAKMLQLDAEKPGAKVLWQTRSDPHALMSTPIFAGPDHLYVVSSYGELGCFAADSGKEIWHTQEPTGNSPLCHAHMTPNGKQVFLFNHKGHLILARLTPARYQEIGRSWLLEPTAGTRAQGPIVWSHPAYANRSVYARNDREFVCATLAANEYQSPPASPAPPQASPIRTFATYAGRNAALALAFSPDGKTLATGTWTGDLKLVDPNTGNDRAALPKHKYWVAALAFSPDGKLLASAGGNEFMKQVELHLWNVASRTEARSLAGHANKVLSAAFSPDGRLLATGSADQTVRLWEVSTGTERAVLKGHGDAVWSIAFTPDGNTVASASWDRTVRLWDIPAGTERGVLKGHDEEVLSVAISPDGRTLATGSADWTVRLWDLATLKEKAVLKGHRGGIYALAFAPDGKTLASGSGDETVRLWSLEPPAEKVILRGHRSAISALAFAPNGVTLATAGADDPIRLWGMASLLSARPVSAK